MRVLNEMENIDDDLEREGIIIIRLDNADEAKEYGLDHLPAMVYFENKIPASYEGDLMNEDEVLEWLVLQKNSATIEEVTDEILSELIDEHEYVVVYFTGDCEEGQKCDKILDDLENIDDELDEAGIIFVTTEEMDIAKKYGIKNLPKLVFFRNKDPLVYSGDLDDEDEVLAWLTDENTLEIPGKIEEVNMKMLEKILAENDHIVVFFCKLPSVSDFFCSLEVVFQILKETRSRRRFSTSLRTSTTSVKRRTSTSSRPATMASRRNTTCQLSLLWPSTATSSALSTPVTS
jgi:hypothetical protein